MLSPQNNLDNTLKHTTMPLTNQEFEKQTDKAFDFEPLTVEVQDQEDYDD